MIFVKVNKKNKVIKPMIKIINSLGKIIHKFKIIYDKYYFYMDSKILILHVTSHCS